MYTIDDNNHDEYEEEYVENSFWNNNKGLIIKIIIIILCIIVLIWLFKALKVSKNNTDNEGVYIANMEKVRLAAEDYFFIKNNKDNSKIVSLSTLKNEGLTGDLVDANNKVCSDTLTNATLQEEADAYKMTVKLSCLNVEKSESFYYHNNTLTCLNCNGKTNMVEKVDNKEEINGGNKNDSNVISVNTNDYNEYSCVNWSDWTKNRITDANLKERSKTLVQGVKYSNTPKTIYGDWSEYTTTPIIAKDDLEVETKIVNESVWSDIKQATSINASSNIRIINTREITDYYDVCKDGFIENNICYSNKVKVGNLTFKEYNSGKYRIQNNYCEGLKTLKNSEGKYVLTYVNCRYNEIINDKVSSDSYTVYEYQELENKNVVYYRSRSVTIVDEKIDPIYTKDKYEETSLPDGYVKVDGTEEVYYSYKYAVCEK